MSLWQAVAIGFGLGVSLAAPPGPVMARMAVDASKGRVRQALAVGLGAASADAVFFTVVAVGALAAQPDPRTFAGLAFLGVVVLCVFAYQAWRTAQRPDLPPPAARTGYLGGFVLAASSPLNWAWWSTSGAGFVITHGTDLAWGFFPALVLVIVASVALFHGLGRVSTRVPQIVAYVSTVLLLAFASALAFHAMTVLDA